MFPKITVKVIVVSSGWIRYHSGPRMVCLVKSISHAWLYQLPYLYPI